MTKEEVQLTSYCGLYCGDCIRYRSRTSELAGALLRELHRARFDKYAEIKSSSVKELKDYKEGCLMLEAIERIHCSTSCRHGGGPASSCKIRECCQKRNFQGCWECSDFERCDKFDFLKPFHGDTPVKNLRTIKEFGLDDWAEYRHKFYIWE